MTELTKGAKKLKTDELMHQLLPTELIDSILLFLPPVYYPLTIRLISKSRFVD